jgi:hypothetical protein
MLERRRTARAVDGLAALAMNAEAARDPRDGKTRGLRVVTLSDGETLHNAFFNRDFKAMAP